MITFSNLSDLDILLEKKKQERLFSGGSKIIDDGSTIVIDLNLMDDWWGPIESVT